MNFPPLISHEQIFITIFALQMVTTKILKNNISEDLKALNQLIERSLECPNSFMQEIIMMYLKSKGKQIRPILVILSAKTFGSVNENVINAAAAIELLHNASLIHDDVVDDSKKRRGLPTINSIWDNSVAVLVGDFFVSNALQCAIKVGDMRIINSISELSKELALGEINQINNARTHNIDEDIYFDIINKKTASLFMSCIEVGGYAVNATTEQIAPLKHFAELLGLCFQIKDDIFDYFEEKNIGKPTGNDLREGKITLPLIYALTNNNGEENDAMIQLTRKDELTTDEIATLINYAKDKGGIEYSYQKMQELRNQAINIIAEYKNNEAFINLLDYIIARDF